MLLAGERTETVTLFKQLAAQPKHPYRRQAEKAAGLIR
jgi:hypothetical protein